MYKTESINAEKAFGNIKRPFMIKCSHKLRVEGNFLNLIKSIYRKTTANMLLNGEKLDALPLRLKTKQECVLSQLLFSVTLEGLANAMKDGNKRYID